MIALRVKLGVATLNRPVLDTKSVYCSILPVRHRAPPDRHVNMNFLKCIIMYTRDFFNVQFYTKFAVLNVDCVVLKINLCSSKILL